MEAAPRPLLWGSLSLDRGRKTRRLGSSVLTSRVRWGAASLPDHPVREAPLRSPGAGPIPGAWELQCERRPLEGVLAAAPGPGPKARLLQQS